MDNHFHLLLETPDGNISRAMHDLNGYYAQLFNKIHDRVGHLFQSRFYASLVDKDEYLLESARYIVLNPVRAKLVTKPDEWKWSSYRVTANPHTSPPWMQSHWILSLFSRQTQIAVTAYKQFVQDGMKQNTFHPQKRNGSVFGGPWFTHDVLKKIDDAENQKDIPRSERMIGRPMLTDVFYDVKNKQERNAAIVFAHKRCGYPLSHIASLIQLDASTVGKIAREKYHVD